MSDGPEFLFVVSENALRAYMRIAIEEVLQGRDVAKVVDELVSDFILQGTYAGTVGG